jgi:hypothetical protein
MLDALQQSKARQSFHCNRSTSNYPVVERAFVRDVERHLQSLTDRAENVIPSFSEALCAKVIAYENALYAQQVKNSLLMSVGVANASVELYSEDVRGRVEFSRFGADLLDCIYVTEESIRTVFSVTFERIAREFEHAHTVSVNDRVFMRMLTQAEVQASAAAADSLPGAHSELTRRRFMMRVIHELLKIPLSDAGRVEPRTSAHIVAAIEAAKAWTCAEREAFTSVAAAVDESSESDGISMKRITAEKYADDIGKIEKALKVRHAFAASMSLARRRVA